MENSQRILHTFILISSRGQSPLNPWPGALPLDLTGASSQTILQARSTTLAQIPPSYIIPSRSLRSSSTTISTPLRKTSIATSRSFSSTASDVWDKVPVHVSSASTLPVFRRQAPFIPSCLPWIQYTDHQSRNLLQYHVVHLTRSSPVPTISWFLHSRLGFTRYWRAFKCCVTYSLTNIQGKEKVCFRSLKMYQNSPTAMQNSKIFPGTKPRTIILGESLFLFSENVLKLSIYSNAEFKNFPADSTTDPRFRGRESLFSFSKNVPKLSYSHVQNSTIFPGTIPRTFVLGGRKVCFRSPKVYLNSPTAMQNRVLQKSMAKNFLSQNLKIKIAPWCFSHSFICCVITYLISCSLVKFKPCHQLPQKICNFKKSLSHNSTYWDNFWQLLYKWFEI